MAELLITGLAVGIVIITGLVVLGIVALILTLRSRRQQRREQLRRIAEHVHKIHNRQRNT